MKTNAIVSDRIYVEAPDALTMADHPFFRAIQQKLVYANPKLATLVRMHKWTGKTDKHIVMYQDVQAADGAYYRAVPRGFDHILVLLAKDHDVDLFWEDKTVYPPLGSTLPQPEGKLDLFQEEAVTQLLRFANGTMESPTGSGKTRMMMAMIPRLLTPTLILVHTKGLLDQIRRCVTEAFHVDAGIIGGGKCSVQDITVGMIQTLSRMDLKANGIAKRFGCVIQDESHHAPASTFSKVLNQMQARYRYGFTATGFRKDHLEFVIWDVIGPIRSKVTRQMAEDAGRIIRPDVHPVKTDYWFDMRGVFRISAERVEVGDDVWADRPSPGRWCKVLGIRSIAGGRIEMASIPVALSFLPLDKVTIRRDDVSRWTEMVTHMTGDEKRNDQIEATIRKRMTSEVRALVLTDRIDHAKHLGARLHDLDPAVLHGELTDTQRKAEMAKVQLGSQLTIATVHLLGEGIDVPAWDLLFLVTPMSRGPRALQVLGRIARVSPGKTEATLIDFVDERIPLVAAAARGRMATYRRK